jgi:hypothetical protein
MRTPEKDAARHTRRSSLAFLEAFEVLGRRYQTAPGKFEFVLVPDWPTPSFSPLVLDPKENLNPADLRMLEHFFLCVRSPNRGVVDTPYLTILQDGRPERLDHIDEVLRAVGWGRDRKPLTVNIFHGPVSPTLPPGVEAEVVAANGRLPPAYAELLRAGFGADDVYLDYVEAAFRMAPSPTWILLLYAQGEVVAGGSVTVGAPWAFLTWGTVLPAQRGKGYHRPLLDSCRALGAARGARASALTTRNERVMGRCDEMIELFICRPAS